MSALGPEGDIRASYYHQLCTIGLLTQSCVKRANDGLRATLDAEFAQYYRNVVAHSSLAYTKPRSDLMDVLEAWEANNAPKIIVFEMPWPKNDLLPDMLWHWQKIHRRYQDCKL